MSTFEWADEPTPLSHVSQKFIVPDENKPNLENVSELDLIPTVDMNKDHETLVRDLSKACQEYGIFQLTNHGIREELCNSVLQVITDFFLLPNEKKRDMLSMTHMEDGKLYKYSITNQKNGDKIFMWGEAFFHTWDPLNESYIERLPSDPPNYRNIVGDYIKEVSSLIMKIFSLISEALGLDNDYFKQRFGKNPQCTAQANYYPPCPNPEQTLGLRDHTDINIITILLADEGVPGLQVQKDDKWFAVNSEKNALIVNVADQLQILTNDKYKSVCHRVVNNTDNKRTTFGIFMGPQDDAKMGPIQELGGEPLYRDYYFEEFMAEFRKQQGKRRMVKEYFLLKNGVAESSN